MQVKSMLGGSSNLKALPSFGCDGVVVSGSEDRNETYLLHNADVKSLRTMEIWPSSNSSIAKSAGWTNGRSGGQSGNTGGASFTFRLGFFPPGFGGMVIGRGRIALGRANRKYCIPCIPFLVLG